MNQHVDVAVIGGGITGLAAAWGAEKQGASCAVFEAGSACGGVIGSEKSNGFLVETGATSMAGSADVMALLSELALTDDVIVPPASSKRRYIFRDGAMCALPSSPLELLRSRVLSNAAKFRALGEIFAPRSTHPAAAESLASLVTRRFGQEVLDYVVDPFVSGVYAGDPGVLSSQFALAPLSELERQHRSILIGALKSARRSRADRAERKNRGEKDIAIPHILSFKRGMQQLPDALAAALQHPVATNTRVLQVDTNGSHWTLDCEQHGVPSRVRANAVVVAVAAHQLRNISFPATLLSAVNRLGEIPHAPVAVVALGYRRSDVTHPLDGFGVLVPHREQRKILGALFNSSMFPGRAESDSVLVTAFVGGARSRVNLTAALAGGLARDEIALLLGARANPLFERVQLWPAGIPQFNLGHEQVELAVAKAESEHLGLTFAGSYRTGVAVGRCLQEGHEAGCRAARVALSAETAGSSEYCTEITGHPQHPDFFVKKALHSV